ncbi:MAG: UvrD-helicase domain-containing protein [Xenococcaceae cyanobacterium]
MTFEIIHKPTFTNQLLLIPKERVVQILEKIEVLRNDPKPHGNLKKKLHGYKGNVYRLRSGDYRIIYTYGDGWVTLLGVDARKDVYKGSKLVAETPEIDISNLPDLETILSPEIAPPPPIIQEKDQKTLLPVTIDEDLLQSLRIPQECFVPLISCRTLDDLITVDVPEEIRNRLFDCITTPNFDRVLAQPSLVTGSTDDLLRFKQGNLLGFLLKLNPEQEKYVNWAINAQGATLLKGSPGTGKSTVALYRVKAIIEALKAAGIEKPKILFTTYTNALVAFSEQLLTSLLGDDIKYVEIKTADAIAFSLVRHQSPKLLSTSQARKLIKQALSQAIASLPGNKLQRYAQQQILDRLNPDYLLEEINSIIEAREITILEAYQATPRNGRKIPLNKTQRQAIWHLREHFYQLLKQNNLITWQQLRTHALQLLRQSPNPPLYDAVIIDEAQDLDPNALRILIQLCRAPNRLFITADANQSIYGSSFRWSDIHSDLKFVGRTGILRINHRTTQEIDLAAHSYLNESVIDCEIGDREYINNGALPAVRAINNNEDEAILLTRFCQTATREYRLGIGSCAILVPTAESGTKLAQQLNYQGLEAHYTDSRELDLHKQGVKILTLKAAKGLEFPIVAIAGFLTSSFPTIARGTPQDVKTEIYNRERRTLFVAMTRAMRALLIVVPAKKPGILLQDFDPQWWNLGSSVA